MSCCNAYPNCCCDTAVPANIVYRGECTDPGTLSSLRFLYGLDYKFCGGRLTNSTGLLNAQVNGSGNYSIAFSDTPKLDPEVVTAAENVTFGNLFVLGSDNRMRQLEVPASSGLFMQTNAAGQLVLGAAPAATVPDPLNINDLTVANQATIEDLEVNGTVEINNLSSGTAVSVLALNSSNELILQGLAQGLTISMFFESPTSPNAASPNSAKTSGSYLVIGNRLFDSGDDNITVTTSESITVQDAGTYLILWNGQFRAGGGAPAKAGIWLEVNGTIINYGNGRTDGNVSGTEASNGAMFPLVGFDVRAYAANDVIKLMLSETASNQETFEVRLIAVRFPNS
jgi:hypothetical protein